MTLGSRLGRARQVDREQIALGQRLIEAGRSTREVVQMFKVHAATLYRALQCEAWLHYA